MCVLGIISFVTNTGMFRVILRIMPMIIVGTKKIGVIIWCLIMNFSLICLIYILELFYRYVLDKALYVKSAVKENQYFHSSWILQHYVQHAVLVIMLAASVPFGVPVVFGEKQDIYRRQLRRICKVVIFNWKLFWHSNKSVKRLWTQLWIKR